MQETGRGKVVITGRFTNGAFVGKVQIGFTAPRSFHLGGGCRKVSYTAHAEVA